MHIFIRWYNLIKNDIKNKDSPNSIFIKNILRIKGEMLRLF